MNGELLERLICNEVLFTAQSTMLRPMTNRRRLLANMALATAGAALPARAASAAGGSEHLISELRRICSRVRIEENDSGLQIHCWVADASVWNGCPEFLTTYSKRVFVRGERLSLTLQGSPAHIVLPPDFQ